MTAPTDPLRPGALARERLAFVCLLAVAFGATVAWTGGLDFPLYQDERQFWRQTRFFAEHWPPSFALVRGYPEPMTPLSFLLWSAEQVAFGGGIAGARLLNLLLGAAAVGLVGLRARPSGWRPWLAACGLLLYPYTLPLSVHLYTDVPAAFFVLLGLWLWTHRRPLASGVAFVLSIATRQYMVTFPLALAAAELAPALLARRSPPWARVLPLALAAATLGGWAFLFEGLAPSPGLERWPRHVVTLGGLVPGHGLYLLTCVGAFFVIPEMLLFRRRPSAEELLGGRSLLLAAAVAGLFACFPPLATGVEMGALNRISMWLLPPESSGMLGLSIRYLAFGVLAWLACVRFARLDLVFWLLLANTLLLFAAHHGWEKYHLPVIWSLWYLRSQGELRAPLGPFARELAAEEAGR
jgi:hypothetical protein